MSSIPQAFPFTPERAIEAVTDFLADPVSAADFPQAILRFRNDRAAKEVGLSDLTDDEWVRHFGRCVPLPGSVIMATNSAFITRILAMAAAFFSPKCAMRAGG
jgi:uncharacterized protein YdiU (UPF0061 family)